jgi:hypothetical protein
MSMAGHPIVLCDAPDLLGASRGDDGQIIASFGGNQLLRFSWGGGLSSPVLKLADNVETAAWAANRACGQDCIFTALSAAGTYRVAFWGNLRTTTGCRHQSASSRDRNCS